MKCCKSLCKWHGTPLNFALHLFAFVILLLGVWGHSWNVILSAIITAIIGHLTQLLSKKGSQKNKK